MITLFLARLLLLLLLYLFVASLITMPSPGRRQAQPVRRLRPTGLAAPARPAAPTPPSTSPTR